MSGGMQDAGLAYLDVFFLFFRDVTKWPELWFPLYKVLRDVCFPKAIGMGYFTTSATRAADDQDGRIRIVGCMLSEWGMRLNELSG